MYKSYVARKIVFLLVILLSIFKSAEANDKKGLLIAAVGLPGSGKSSVCQELAKEIGAEVFVEPEEKEWPDAVMKRHMSGNFTMLCWFRSIRVPKLFQADAVKQSGSIAIMDSYYDKLLLYYLAKPGMQWLLSKSDPYYSVAEDMAKKDWDLLPSADVIVFFDVDQTTWRSFLKMRDRQIDNDDEFLKSYETNSLFKEAAEQFAQETGAVCLNFHQQVSTPREAALKLKSQLIQEGILCQ